MVSADVSNANSGEKTLNVLVIRGSFASLGGAERELLTVLRAWGERWQVSVATLGLTEGAMELAQELEVNWICPQKPTELPTDSISEIRGKASKFATKAWKKLAAQNNSLITAINNADAIHISVCRGSLEILPLIPKTKPIHYHCLEPPRWLYEDVLHKEVDGKPKRPMWLTNLIFSKQRRIDRKLVRDLLARPGSAISGNSHHIQANLGKFYNIDVNPNLANGEPAQRDNQGRCKGASVLMHVVDISDWPLVPDEEEINAQLSPKPDSPYVVTVGRIGWVKGTWETLHSLTGTGLGLAQVGGGSAEDKQKIIAEAKRIGVPIWTMPRLSQAALRKLVRGAVAMVSHAHGEPFGLTPIEAMAIGIPALFVDEGGFHWTMKDAKSGLLIGRAPLRAETYDAMTKDWHQAYQMAQNLEIRKEWADTGRPHVEGKFTLNVQADALERLLKDCIHHAEEQ